MEESAGSAAELFIILPPRDSERRVGFFPPTGEEWREGVREGGRERGRQEARLGFTETEIDGVIQRERQRFKKEKKEVKEERERCLLCSPDVRRCAAESSCALVLPCTAAAAAARSPDVGQNTHRALFTHGHNVRVCVRVCLMLLCPSFCKRVVFFPGRPP